MSATNITLNCRTEPDYTTTCDACGHSHALGTRPSGSAITSGGRVFAVVVEGEATAVYHTDCIDVFELRRLAVEEGGVPVEATYEVVGEDGHLNDVVVR